MLPEKVKRKFLQRGRQSAFARHARVSRVTVSDWLKGKTVSARLDSLARSWRPTLDVQPVESCDRPGCPGAV